MHELSLIQSLLDIIEDYAQKRHFKKVNTVKLSFGKLSSIEPKCLEFAFEAQSKETKAQGATLEFDILPIVIYCISCEKEMKVDAYTATCPQCKGEDVIMVGGAQELKIIELDVD
jgi:hydrogenase nickel incorporation protein HypA/HybF